MTTAGWALGSHRRLGVVAVASILTLLAATPSAPAQMGQGTYVAQSTRRLAGLIEKHERDQYRLSENGLIAGGAWLNQSRNEWLPLLTIRMVKEQEYCILAAGDDDTLDADVRIVRTISPKEETGKVEEIAADTSTDPDAVIKGFRPLASADYRIEMRLYDSRDQLPCVCIAAVMEKVAKAPSQARQFDQPPQRLLGLIAHSNKDGYRLPVAKASKEGDAAADDQASIGSAWVAGKNEETWAPLQKVRLQQDKQYRVLASGDDNAEDVHVRLVDAAGNVVASDTTADVDAVLKEFRPPKSQVYTIQVRLYKARASHGVCFAAILEKRVPGSTKVPEAQDAELTQAARRLSELLAGAKKAGYQLAPNQPAIAGGRIRQGTGDTWVPLQTIPSVQGKDYRVLATADESARDVDLLVSRSAAHVVASDTTVGVNALVGFRRRDGEPSPVKVEDHEVKVRLYASRDNVPAVCLTVVAEKQRGAATTHQDEQGLFVIQAAQRLADLTTRAQKDGYRFPIDQRAIGGGWVTQTQDRWVALGTIRLEPGKNYRALAAGDEDVKRLELRVVDQSGAVVKGLAPSNDQAILELRAPKTADHHVQVRLLDSRDNLPCLLLAAVLEKR